MDIYVQTMRLRVRDAMLLLLWLLRRNCERVWAGPRRRSGRGRRRTWAAWTKEALLTKTQMYLAPFGGKTSQRADFEKVQGLPLRHRTIAA